MGVEQAKGLKLGSSYPYLYVIVHSNFNLFTV